VFCPFSLSKFSKYTFLTKKLPLKVFCKYAFPAIGSIHGVQLPAIIDMLAVGAIAVK
jgi:hypothetical protein